MARELRSDAQSAWPGIIVHFRATLAGMTLTEKIETDKVNVVR